jgi:hypothetical protein
MEKPAQLEELDQLALDQLDRKVFKGILDQQDRIKLVKWEIRGRQVFEEIQGLLERLGKPEQLAPLVQLVILVQLADVEKLDQLVLLVQLVFEEILDRVI